MLYAVKNKCIHLWRVTGRWEEGKVFHCEKCRESIKAKENKRKFVEGECFVAGGGSENLKDDETKTRIGMGDKAKPRSDIGDV